MGGWPRSVVLRVAGVMLAAGMGMCDAAAQVAAVSYEDVRFQRYGVEDGLSQTSAVSMLQDEAGYVWIGTQDGLNRFDGYEFRVYRNDPRDPGSVPDNNVPILERASEGGFWLGTLTSGVGRYLPAQDRFERHVADGRPGSLLSNVVTALHEDAQGRLWVAGSGGELQWLAKGSDRFESVAPDVSAQVGPITSILPLGKDVLLGAQSGLWLMSRDGRRVRRWSEGQGVPVETLELAPKGGGVWVGTRTEGLLHFDLEGRRLQQWRRAEGLPDEQVRDLQFDDRGQLWIATFDGLARLDAADAPMRVWLFGAGLAGTLASSRIHSLMLDRDGLLWAGTWLNGVSVHVPATRSFGEIQVKEAGARGSFSTAVTAVHVDADGTFWLGAVERMGLVHYDLRRGLLAQFSHDPADPRSLPSPRITHVVRDRRGRLWVASSGGLARLDGNRFTVFRHDPADPDGLPHNSLRRLYVDRAGTLWVGTFDGKLASLCETCTKFRRYTLMAAGVRTAGGAGVEAIFEDSRGNFWAGGLLGGLLRIDRATGRIERFRADIHRPGAISHDTVTAIVEDRRGRLWVGTQGGGVNRVDMDAQGRPYFSAYGIQEGLATNAVGGIVEDAAGNLWISTTEGISRLDPQTGRIANFGASTGTQLLGYFVGDFSAVPDGRIAFGGMRGVTVFDPGRVQAMPAPWRVALTDLRLQRVDPQSPSSPRAVDVEGTRVLPPEGDDITLGFSALSFADPDSLQYAYRLEGVNDTWVNVDARHRVASYNNLPPGRYVFRARARTPGGEWGQELALPIRLLPPWWRTAWAKTLYVLVALLTGLGLAWAVRARLVERERARRQIADSEARLKLALWGTGDELWDWDLNRMTVRRQNPLDSMDFDETERVEDASVLSSNVHPDDRGLFDQALADHVAGHEEFIDVSYRVRDRYGQWRWRLSRGRVVRRNAAGQPMRIVGTNSDITGLKENEVELARVNAELESRVQRRTEALHATNESLRHTIDELQQAQQQLVEAEKMAALGGLVAGVAHEINTPLGVGVTAASHLEMETRKLGRLIDAQALDPATLEHFRHVATESSQLILRNLQRADRMVKSFRQVAVDQSNEEIRRIELRSYLDEVLISLQPTLRQHRHRVEVACDEPVHVETYPGAIYQIVANLVMNSLTHGYAGRDQGCMRIRLGVEDGQVVLDYRDDGAGMTEDACRRVFDPFFTTRRGSGGSGLGMHIAWNLATQLLGGSIVCEYMPGQGAHFVLRFPVQPRKA
ncbi:two-component regulator propeller domain-containing protein [Agrilutibacter solisilvae]|uniref:histidine kinase n=1 Tax=Agrilutibacter solisilvae TaxID=2763317 RepID=A0A974XZV8_9GAMM|nr:two-component regulator propeller domain-containing protein [Lysobacter solisilvae]QSX77988.1 PAS domain-containing protein [Lysobacter solisilvae]